MKCEYIYAFQLRTYHHVSDFFFVQNRAGFLKTVTGWMHLISYEIWR
jgi:hypothetical protein